MTKIATQLTQLVGNTPLLELSAYNQSKSLAATIIGKLEYFNPAGSVKDRVALAKPLSATVSSPPAPPSSSPPVATPA